jgi:hypothetical protein
MAGILRLSGANRPVHADQRPSRQSKRRKSAVAAEVVVSSSGQRMKARLSDVSEHGCSVTGVDLQLRVGQIVQLSFSSGDSAAGIARWIGSDCAGIEFLRPISASTIGSISD